MPGIFISYRRSDSGDVTGRIYDRLVQSFGRDLVFKDVDGIPLGVAFDRHLSEVISNSACALIVIGPRWVSAKDSDGRTRITKDDDYVRMEVEASLAANIPVVPLFVSGGSMPLIYELPETMLELRKRNGIPVRADPDFHNDMDRLISKIRPHVVEQESAANQPNVNHKKKQPRKKIPKTTVDASLNRGWSYLATKDVLPVWLRSGTIGSCWLKGIWVLLWILITIAKDGNLIWLAMTMLNTWFFIDSIKKYRNQLRDSAE
jgi:TIR domain